MKPDSLTVKSEKLAASLERKRVALLIRQILHKAGVSEAQLAEFATMTPKTLRSVLNGAHTAWQGRQRVTNVLGVQIWPEVKPKPVPGGGRGLAFVAVGTQTKAAK